MNAIWNLLDWILPSVRLSDDLEGPQIIPDASFPPSTIPSSTISTYPPTHRFFTRPSHASLRGQQQQQPQNTQQQPQLVERSKGWDWQRERERERETEREREKERERERQREKERERDRQKILSLERENALLSQKVAQLEVDLRSANQTIAALDLVAAPHIPLPSNILQFPPPPPNPVALKATYEKLLGAYNLSQRAVLERTEEISSLKSYLSKNDEVSGAQILQALRDLNTEIVQLAASVAEEFSSSMDRHIDLAKPADRDLVSNVLGPVLTNLLATRDHEGDPTLVQFAIQAWEVICIGKVLDSFCFGLPSEVDQAFLRIFDHMHHSEPQPVTSRWRALTHAHARALISPSPSSPTTRPPPSPFLTLAETNLRGLLAILAISGCTDPKGTHVQPFRDRFGHTLLRISERVERISNVTNEGIMSSCFEVLWVGSRRKAGLSGMGEGEKGFDPQRMENVYAGHGSEKGGVLCTVEFGLMCVRKAGSNGANGESPYQQQMQHQGETNGVVRVNGNVNGVTNGMVNGHMNGYAYTNGVVKPQANGTSSESVHRSLLLKPKILLNSVVEIL